MIVTILRRYAVSSPRRTRVQLSAPRHKPWKATLLGKGCQSDVGTDHRKPRLEVVAWFADTFGLTLSDLLRFEDEEE